MLVNLWLRPYLGFTDGAGIGIKMPTVFVKNKADAVQTWSMRGLRVKDDEIILNIPVWCRGKKGLLVRRLADGYFILLVPKGSQLSDSPLLSAMPELPNLLLGVARVANLMPPQFSDGELERYLITLSDETLGGLLGTEPLP